MNRQTRKFQKPNETKLQKNHRQDHHNDNSEINKKIRSLLASTCFSIFMSVLTIYTIFAIDIDKAVFEADASHYFSSIHLLSILIFITEIVLMMKTQNNYLWKFYFWIDVFSTLTMFLEIIWIQDLMNSVDNIQVAISFARVTKASRFSKIGARSSKIMKLIRLVRLMKFFKKEENEEGEQEIKETQILSTQNKQKIIEQQPQQPENRDLFWMKQDIGGREKCVNQIYIDHEEENSQYFMKKSQNEEDFIEINKMKRNKFGGSESNVEKQLEKLNKLKKKKSIKEKKEKKKTKFKERKGSQINLYEESLKVNQIESSQIVRRNVDPEKLREIEERWQQLSQLAKKQQEDFESDNTKVGQVLKDEIQKNIVLMVMGVIIIIPLLSADTWFDKNASVSYVIFDFLQMDNLNVTQKEDWVNVFVNQAIQMSNPLTDLSVTINNIEWSYPQSFPSSLVYDQYFPLDKLRKSQKTVTINDGIEVVFSKKKDSQVNSIIGMIRSVFITFLLILSSLLFIQDIQTYALHPLEKMSNTIQKISKNPFAAVINNQEEQDEEDKLLKEDEDQLELETNILENSIIRISNLLAVGLGELGTNFIMREIELESTNELNSTNEASRSMCTMVEGVYVCLTIAHFSEITKILQNKTLLFINTIADIIHENALKMGGNLCHEDEKTFLLFWKFDKNMKNIATTALLKNFEEEFHIRQKKKEKIGELAILSYLKIIKELTLNEKIQDQKDINEFIEEYDDIRVYAGLHFGHAICGSVGSDQKIEAKLLSIDVMMARFLCRLAADSNIKNLISENLFDLLSSRVQNRIRKVVETTLIFPQCSCESVDNEQIQLYTLDYMIENIESEKEMKMIESKDQEQLQEHLKKIYKERNKLLDLIEEKKEIHDIVQFQEFNTLTSGFGEEWAEAWREALQTYYQGNWDLAKTYFTTANDLYPQRTDNISKKFIQQINRHKGDPPINWKENNFIKFVY